jgi:hypothetical protein
MRYDFFQARHPWGRWSLIRPINTNIPTSGDSFWYDGGQAVNLHTKPASMVRGLRMEGTKGLPSPEDSRSDNKRGTRYQTKGDVPGRRRA